MAAGDLLARDGQVEWRGVLFGPGTSARTVGLEGLHDLPGMRDTAASISGFHGSFPTPLLLDRRYVTWNYRVVQAPAAFLTAVATLLRVTTLPEPGPAAPEESLCVQIDGQRFLMFGQVMRRQVPTDRNYALGVTSGAVQWVCADPRVFLLPQRTATAGLATAGAGGLVFPLVFPLNFGTGSAGGVVTLTNPGRAEAWPLFRLTGPAPGPIITDLDRGWLLRFDPAWTLPAGQTIEIDTRPGYRTVTFVPSGVSASARLFTRQWFSVPAGSAGLRVSFSAGVYDPAAQITALWYATAQ